MICPQIFPSIKDPLILGVHQNVVVLERPFLAPLHQGIAFCDFSVFNCFRRVCTAVRPETTASISRRKLRAFPILSDEMTEVFPADRDLAGNRVPLFRKPTVRRTRCTNMLDFQHFNVDLGVAPLIRNTKFWSVHNYHVVSASP
jgi:hypothetical protein